VVDSRAYGWDNVESDTDCRGVYLAPSKLQWSLFGAPGQSEDNATKSYYGELQKFFTVALRVRNSGHLSDQTPPIKHLELDFPQN
jgi:predicted nucleotidyltransferase